MAGGLDGLVADSAHLDVIVPFASELLGIRVVAERWNRRVRDHDRFEVEPSIAQVSNATKSVRDMGYPHWEELTRVRLHRLVGEQCIRESPRETVVWTGVSIRRIFPSTGEACPRTG